MKKTKYVVNYGDVDIYEGANSFWLGCVVIVCLCILIAKVLL